MKGLNLKQFKKTGGDDDHTIMASPTGHEIKILHKPLAKHHAQALKDLPVAKMSEGGEPQSQPSGTPGGTGSPYQDPKKAKQIEDSSQESGWQPAKWKQNLKEGLGLAKGGPVQQYAEGDAVTAPDPTSSATGGIDPTLQDNGMPANQAPALDPVTVQKREMYNQAAASPAYGLQTFGPNGEAPKDFNANIWNDIVEPGYADKAAGEAAKTQEASAQSQAENKARQAAGLPPVQGNQTPSQQPTAAGTTPPPQQTAANSDPYGAGVAGDTFYKGLQGEIDAQQSLGQHEDQSIRAQAAASNAAANKITQNLDMGKQEMAKIDNDTQGYMKALLAGHIDPNRLVSNMSTGDRIGAGIGLLLGGFGAGISGQPNQALEFLNKQIDRDIAAQQSDLGRKENLLSVNLRRYGNAKDATEMTAAQLKMAAAYQIAGAGANAAGAAAKDRANMGANAMLKDAANQIGQIQMRRSIGASTPGSVPPEQFIRAYLPENEKPAALKELEQAQNAVSLRDNALSAYDQLTKINTLGNRITSPIQTPARVKAIAGPVLDKLTKDTSGRVTPETVNLIGGIMAKPGQDEQTQKIQRQQLNNLLTQGMHYPTLKQYNLDPMRESRYDPSGNSRIQVMPPALKK